MSMGVLVVYHSCTEFIQCPDCTIANSTITINPLNGSLNSLATYMCNDGFALKGDPTSVCPMDSTWNNTVSECGK